MNGTEPSLGLGRDDSASARYEIGRVLGRGSHAVVHEGFDRVDGRRVAIKCFPVGSRRADREARALEALAHRFVVPFHERVETTHQTQLVQSRGLHSLEDDAHPPSVARVAWCVAQLAAALDAIHARGWTHRDVKPANVLVAPGGEVWLADFSTALPDDEPGSFEGTPHYMSPEAARSDAEGPRHARDWYALGVLLFELATGQVPFSDEDPTEILRKQLRAPRPSLKGTAFATLEPCLEPWLRVEPRQRAGGGPDATRRLLGALPRRERPSRVSILARDPVRAEAIARLVADEAPALRVRVSNDAADLVVFDDSVSASELPVSGAYLAVGSSREAHAEPIRGCAIGWRSWNALSTRLALRCWAWDPVSTTTVSRSTTRRGSTTCREIRSTHVVEPAPTRAHGSRNPKGRSS